MTPGLRCQGTTAKGEPCGAPERLIDPTTGFCASHDPEKREALREAARKGGEATARKLRGTGLDPDTLPASFDGPKDAADCLEAIVRGTLTGRVGHREATAATRAIREWLRAHEAGVMVEEMEALTEALREWRETGDPTPVLEVVE